MNCYEVIAGQTVSKEIKTLVDAVQAGMRTIASNKGLFNYGNSITTVQPVDILRYFVELNLDDSTNKALTNIFLSHLSSTESKSAGSGAIFCTAFCLYMQKGLRLQHLKDKRDTFSVHTFKGKRADPKSLLNVMKSFCDPVTARLIYDASKHVGAEGSIAINTHSTGHRTTLTLDDMYRFDCNVNEVFSQQTGRSNFKLSNPSIVTIDGYIESTSEIDSLMRKSFETGQSLALIARGFHQDVANTLAHNYVHGKLKVLPLEVRYDEVGANSLIDISKVAQSKFVNSLRGDLISTISFDDDAGVVQSVDVKSGYISIDANFENGSIGQKMIQRQRLKLMKKLENSSEAVKKILDSRIKSLTPSFCSVSIKADKGMSGIEKDRALSAVRIMKDVCSFGFVDLTTVEIHDSYFIENLLKDLTAMDITNVSTRAINTGIYSAAACAETYLRLGACLVVDEYSDTCV